MLKVLLLDLHTQIALSPSKTLQALANFHIKRLMFFSVTYLHRLSEYQKRLNASFAN